MSEYPTMTPERDAFVDELRTGEFGKKLPKQISDPDPVARQEINTQIHETGHHLAAMTALFGADKAIEIKSAAIAAMIQTVASHITVCKVAGGASPMEAREAVLNWLEQLAADGSKLSSFIFSHDPDELAPISQWLTPNEIEGAKGNAAAKIEKARPILFSTLAVHLDRIINNFPHRQFVSTVRLRFGKMLDAWKGEAEAAMQDALGADPKPRLH